MPACDSWHCARAAEEVPSLAAGAWPTYIVQRVWILTTLIAAFCPGKNRERRKRRKMLKTGFSRAMLLTATCLMLTPLTTTAQDSGKSDGYRVLNKWKIGGEGGWDYISVDPATRELYITRGPHVLVLNTSTGKVIAEITGFRGTHGVVFDSAARLGYISDGASNQVAVFDRKTHAVLAKVNTGVNPDGLLYEPFTKTVWAFNGRSHSATVIDTSKNKVLATIDLPGKPEFPASDGKGSVFVNIEDKSLLQHIDAKSMKALEAWPLAPCESPSGLAIDALHEKLFSVCDGKVMTVTDGTSGQVVTTAPIGDGPDAAAFDPMRKLVFSSNGEGNLTVVHQDSPTKYSVLATVSTQRSARTMALDEKTGKAYLVAAEFGPRPQPTAANPHPWPTIVPGSFVVLVVGKE